MINIDVMKGIIKKIIDGCKGILPTGLIILVVGVIAYALSSCGTARTSVKVTNAADASTTIQVTGGQTNVSTTTTTRVVADTTAVR